MDSAKNQASHLRIPKVGMSFKKKKKKDFLIKEMWHTHVFKNLS